VKNEWSFKTTPSIYLHGKDRDCFLLHKFVDDPVRVADYVVSNGTLLCARAWVRVGVVGVSTSTVVGAFLKFKTPGTQHSVRLQ